MSSYELLELLEFMPDDGAFQTALRDGEYSSRDIVWRHVANELSKLRSITQTVHGGKPTDIKTFPTVSEIREAARDAEESEERREVIFAFADRTPDPEFEDADI